MNTRVSTVEVRAALVAIAIALVASCATTPPHYPALEDARAAAASAHANPDTARYSALELNKADQLLSQAEAAAKDRHVDELNQYAYLSMQSSKVALAHAREKAAQAHVAASEAERQKVQLEARTREAELAKAQARAATSDADAARARARDAEAEAAAAAAAMQKMQAELADLHATQTTRGLMVRLGDVLFDTGRSELKAGATRTLGELVRVLAEHPERRLLVEGFTDSVGSDEFNLDLSRRRAEAVKSALVVQGVSSDRVDTSGLGKNYPIASNDEAAGRQLNRRVELIISDASGHIPSR